MARQGEHMIFTSRGAIQRAARSGVSFCQASSVVRNSIEMPIQALANLGPAFRKLCEREVLGSFPDCATNFRKVPVGAARVQRTEHGGTPTL